MDTALIHELDMLHYYTNFGQVPLKITKVLTN